MGLDVCYSFLNEKKGFILLIFQKKSICSIKRVEEKDLLKEKDFDFFENLKRKEMKRKGFRPTLLKPVILVVKIIAV